MLLVLALVTFKGVHSLPAPMPQALDEIDSMIEAREPEPLGTGIVCIRSPCGSQGSGGFGGLGGLGGTIKSGRI
jgi:hypothetical protein